MYINTNNMSYSDKKNVKIIFVIELYIHWASYSTYIFTIYIVVSNEIRINSIFRNHFICYYLVYYRNKHFITSVHLQLENTVNISKKNL